MLALDKMPLGKKLLQDLGVQKSAIHETPPKEKKLEMPSTNVYVKNAVHQADLLFLPDDQGYKYALVVVDLHTGLTEAEPLKGKTPNVVSQALDKIYARKVLDYPNRLETDPGTEFKGSFPAFLEAKNVEIRHGKTGRHRQQAVVESRNGVLAEALNLRMSGLEQISGQTSRLWVDYLPKVITAINNNLPVKSKVDRADQIDKKTGKLKYPFEVGGGQMLEEGTQVRVILEQPKDYVSGKTLHGRFRKGDARWDKEIRTIKQVIMRPDQPIMYLVSDPKHDDQVEKVGYTRKQLQVVTNNEPEPDPVKLDAPDFETYQVKEIIKKQGNKYLIRWIGYPDPKDYTWETRASLIQNKNVKKLIDQFK